MVNFSRYCAFSKSCCTSGSPFSIANRQFLAPFSYNEYSARRSQHQIRKMIDSTHRRRRLIPPQAVFKWSLSMTVYQAVLKPAAHRKLLQHYDAKNKNGSQTLEVREVLYSEHKGMLGNDVLYVAIPDACKIVPRIKNYVQYSLNSESYYCSLA